MKFEMKFLVMILFFAVNLFSQEAAYRVFDEEIDKKMVVDYKKKVFEKIFSNTLVSWDEDGLYIFADYQGLQKLFVFGHDDTVRIFTMPKMCSLPWVNPEKYYEEQKSFFAKTWDTECFSERVLDSERIQSIMQLQIWKWPYIATYKHYNVLPMVDRAMFTGFYKNNGKEHWFYLKDFRNGSELKKPLDVYGLFFDIIESLPFTEEMKKCK